MARVFVVGSLNIDQSVRVVGLPGHGETVIGSNVAITAGGKGGNQAVAAARAGASVVMVGAIGDDTHGARVTRDLQDSGVDIAHLRVTQEPTGLAIITVDEPGENFIVVIPGANAHLREEDVDRGLARIEAGDVLLLQLETPEAIVRHAAQVAKRRGALVVLNAAPAPSTIGGLLHEVDVLIVNEHEALRVAELCGLSCQSVPDLVTGLALALDLKVVCTAGADGAYTNVGDEVEHIEGLSVVAVDTTGAGDTFAGYLAAGLAFRPADPRSALDQATQASALTVTRHGSMSSIPSKAALSGKSNVATIKGVSF
jgi:ribokinase